MSSSKFITLLLILGILIFPTLQSQVAYAQNANDALSFGNQAVNFGSQQYSFDPVTGVMPGTAYAAGFGSFLDNPASAALFSKSFGEFGVSFNTVNEEGLYLGNSSSLEDNQFNLSNVGMVYKFPTERGRLVVGGGYNQHTSFNRALGFNARNENSTITDQFKIPGNTYADIAFNTFATDFGDEFGDWDESIFRVGFDEPGDFLGVRQQGEIYERGHGGEYSAFLATEFQQNLMVGVSVGILAGRFSYDRIFQEIDEFNDYDADFIDSNDDGEGDTDIDNIIFSDEIESRYSGFRGRIGALYQIGEFLNIGGSYTLPTRISVDETFDATIRSTFNNGVTFDDSIEGRFSYSVRHPSRFSIGAALDELGGLLSVSVSGEYVDYSATRIDFESDEMFEDQQIENEFISETFTPVWNLRSGVALQLNPGFTIRGGFGLSPSKFKDGNDDRYHYSLGTGFAISRNASFEIGARYSTWEENSAVYTYGDLDYSTLPDAAPPVDIRSEDAFRTVDQFQVMGTLRLRMN